MSSWWSARRSTACWRASSVLPPSPRVVTHRITAIDRNALAGASNVGHHRASTMHRELALNSSTWRTPTVVLVCGGLILLLAIGTRQSFGLFLVPMSLDLGWGRETFSFAIALQNLVWGLAMPFVGAIADRFGAARVLAAGGLAYAVGL